MKNLAIILIFAAALAACGPRGGGEIPVLDVTRTYPSRNVILQDIADVVEYIPLETREGFLLDFVQVRYMDDEVIVSNNNAGDIMFFDRRTGKGLQSFNRKGRGPGEYTGIHGIAVDRAGGEMFVTPNSISSNDYPVYVYDMEGKPLRTIGLKRGIQFPSFLHNYDEGHLFYRNTGSPEVMGLLSKTDSLVTYLPVRLEGRENMTVYREEVSGENRVVYGNSAGNPIARTSDGLVLSEPGVDTMWRWRTASQELVPVMTRTPAWGAMGEFPVGVFFAAETDDYMFVQTIERKWDFAANKGFDKVNLVLDKRTGEFFEGGLVNADFVDEKQVVPSISAGVPGGVFVASLQPYELIDLHETGKLRGRLAELAPMLKEDDNPVMMIVTFK